jgi:hypothetical protein
MVMPSSSSLTSIVPLLLSNFQLLAVADADDAAAPMTNVET